MPGRLLLLLVDRVHSGQARRGQWERESRVFVRGALLHGFVALEDQVVSCRKRGRPGEGRAVVSTSGTGGRAGWLMTTESARGVRATVPQTPEFGF